MVLICFFTILWLDSLVVVTVCFPISIKYLLGAFLSLNRDRHSLQCFSRLMVVFCKKKDLISSIVDMKCCHISMHLLGPSFETFRCFYSFFIWFISSWPINCIRSHLSLLWNFLWYISTWSYDEMGVTWTASNYIDDRVLF